MFRLQTRLSNPDWNPCPFGCLRKMLHINLGLWWLSENIWSWAIPAYSYPASSSNWTYLRQVCQKLWYRSQKVPPPFTKSPYHRGKEKKTACTNAQSVRDLSITKRIWNGTWPNTKKELSKKATINRKKSLFATSVEKSMETTNLGSITSRVTALSTNAKLVLEASRRLVVSNTTWHSILVLLHSIVESAEKLL